MKQRKQDKPWSRPRPDFVAGEHMRRLTAERQKQSGRRAREERKMRTSLEKAENSVQNAAKKAAVPPWFAPLIVLAVLLGVLLIIPGILNLRKADPGKSVDDHRTYVSIYAENVRVVNVPAATIYAEPDIKAERIGQVLFNSPVQVTETEHEQSGFVYLTTLDGKQGYVRPDELSKDRQSIEPDLYTHKVVVTDLQKSVMTHASNGNLMIEVKRGTVLYVLYDGTNLFRVQLPDGGEGWVSSTGLFKLSAKVDIPVTDNEAFTSYVLAFDQTKFMEHGLTNEGIDMPGVLSVTSYINGVPLPSDISALAETGETVENAVVQPSYLDTKVLRSGDVIYFKPIVGYDGDNQAIGGEEVEKLGIWLGDDQILTDSQRTFSIVRQQPDSIFSAWIPYRVARYFH